MNFTNSFYFLEEPSPRVLSRVRVFGGEDEGSFAHDEIFGDRTDITGIPGVEYLVPGDEIPVFAERVLSDKGISEVDLTSPDRNRSLGFVGNDSVIQGVVGRVDRDGCPGCGDIERTEVLYIPGMAGVKRKSVIDSRRVLSQVTMQALLILHVAITAFAVHEIDSFRDRDRVTR